MSRSTPSEALAAEVRAWLARRRISQADAAKHLGIGQASMSRRLAGASSFTVTELYGLAELFGISASDLLDTKAAS